jgi:hypothetical protein
VSESGYSGPSHDDMLLSQRETRGLDCVPGVGPGATWVLKKVSSASIRRAQLNLCPVHRRGAREFVTDRGYIEGISWQLFPDSTERGL